MADDDGALGRTESQRMVAEYLDTEDPLAFLAAVARDGNVELEEFRMVVNTPIKAIIRGGVLQIMGRLPPGLRGQARLEQVVDGAMHGLEMRSNLLIPQLFKFFDRNRDGRISEAEVREVLDLFARQDLPSLLAILDVNGDGHLSKDSLTALLADLFETVVMFSDQLIDSLSQVLLFDSALIHNALTLAYMFVDQDGDGAVTVDDLLVLIPPDMLQMLEMQLNALADSPQSPYGMMMASYHRTREQFVEASSKSDDGQVSEATMYRMAHGNIREDFMQGVNHGMQQAAVLNPGAAALPPAIVALLSENVPAVMERKFPALFSAVFKLIDKNGDGRVSLAEFESMFRVAEAFAPQVAGNPPINRVRTLLVSVLSIFDINMDGRVTIEEAEIITKRMLRLVLEIIHVYLAIIKEVGLLLIRTEALDPIFQVLDPENTGRVSLARAAEAVPQIPMLLAMRQQGMLMQQQPPMDNDGDGGYAE